MRKLSEILASRGRKGTSAEDQMALLYRLRSVCGEVFHIVDFLGGWAPEAWDGAGSESVHASHCSTLRRSQQRVVAHERN